ncbi:MAG: hypothetical protein EOP54_19600 [Sphingobacteriales bacterium]|nr:MAG: hypothetical protein EOP54_19600 [Sphingobacteriales bacterium]
MKHLNRRIRRLEAQIANIKTLPYYRIFNREDERAADLAEAQQQLERLKSCQLPVAGRHTVQVMWEFTS